jgi:type III secretory pathway component EscU
MMLIYFRIDLLGGIIAYLPDWAWVKKVKSSIVTFNGVTSTTLFSLLGVSLIRYITYLSQYVLIIYFFGVTDNFFASVLGVITIFFLQSNLPLPPALSVLARGEMAIFLWSVFTTNVLGVLAASFTLWLINLVFPAILGTIIISQAKIFEE